MFVKKFIFNSIILSLSLFVLTHCVYNSVSFGGQAVGTNPSSNNATDQSTVPTSAQMQPSVRALELAKKALQDANTVRVQNNLAPLQWNQDIADQANIHSKAMADTKVLSHDGFMDRYKNIGSKHPNLAMGENVAESFDQGDVAQTVTNMWMSDEPH